ncbi:MAG TPA: hypothetical protein VF522_15400 [Ramlibacter sp.]|uniref:hypothetical protein n=1 Tax=Ramlibacter sp. TaxID=1917967 RepID=UPI002ED4AD8A
MSTSEASKSQIIEAITAPLGFFVLALLIVEAFLATVLIGAELQNTDRVFGMYLGVGLFILVVVVVGLFVWFKPENLTFDKEAHLRDRNRPPFGTAAATRLSPQALVPVEPGGSN